MAEDDFPPAEAKRRFTAALILMAHAVRPEGGWARGRRTQTQLGDIATEDLEKAAQAARERAAGERAEKQAAFDAKMTRPKPKDPDAVLLGHKGGVAAAKNRTQAERSDLARKASAARWGKPMPEHDDLTPEERERRAEAASAAGERERNEREERARTRWSIAEDRERRDLAKKMGLVPKRFSTEELAALENFKGEVRQAQARQRKAAPPKPAKTSSRSAQRARAEEAADFIVEAGFTAREACAQTGAHRATVNMVLRERQKAGKDMGLYTQAIGRARTAGQSKRHRKARQAKLTAKLKERPNADD